MAERWSSTPPVWVRFLLPLNLIIFPKSLEIRKPRLNSQLLKNKNPKHFKRLFRRKRVLKRWKSWFDYSNRSRIILKKPLWIFSKTRFKAETRSNFLMTYPNNLGFIKPKRRRIRKLRRYREWNYARPVLFKKSITQRKWFWGSYRRFFLPQHSVSNHLTKISFLRYILRNRSFFKIYKFSRSTRTLVALLKSLNRISPSSNHSSINIQNFLQKVGNKVSLTTNNLGVLPYYKPRKSSLEIKKYKLSMQQIRIKQVWTRKQKIKSSAKLVDPQLYFYSLLWKATLVSTASRGVKLVENANFRLSTELNRMYLHTIQSKDNKQSNSFNYPHFNFLVLTFLHSHIYHLKSNIFQFLQKFKHLAQLTVNYDKASYKLFNTNRFNFSNQPYPISTVPSKLIEKQASQIVALRSLRKGVPISRRKKPKQRGFINGRLMKHYHELQNLRISHNLSFLSKLSLISNLNKLFIRFLKTKVTHYRINQEEFFTNYLIRLNPRHIVYNASNYKHVFRSHSLKFFEKSNLYSTFSKKLLTSFKDKLTTQRDSLGVFNIVASLHNNQLFNSYSDNNKRRRKLLRKKWQFKTCFIRHIFNSKAFVYKSRLKQVLLQKVSLPKQRLNRSVGDKNSNLIIQLLLTSKLLKSSSYLINYLSFSFFSIYKQNWALKTKNLTLGLSNEAGLGFFNNRVNIYNTSNLIPRKFFQYSIKRKLLKLFKFHKFSQNVVMWYYNMLIRFMEFCSGKKISIRFNPFLENYLTFVDLARCSVWSGRVRSFQRILGPKIFLNESLKILCLALRHKDPTFLSNWLRGMLYRMSFWKYRLLFRYLKFLLRYLFFPYFNEIGFKGFKLRLKGKISVAGNARTRTLHYAIGETSYSQFNHRIVSDYSTINTFTGVLGFRIWFFF